MGEPQVKGLRFNRIAELLRELGEPGSYETLLASVSVPTAQLLHRPPSATEWIPLAPLDDLMRTGHRVCYGGDLERVFEQGRRSFIRDVKTVYRFFIRFASPDYVARRASQIYSIYYKENGSLRVLDSAPNRIALRYEDVKNGGPVFWAQSRGTIYGALEATGMKGVAVAAEGGTSTSCAFTATWK